MGKKNKGGGGYKPPDLPPSFFQQQKQKLGPDFMSRLNTEIVKRNALRIFKDLSTGAINVDHEYAFFNIYDFTYALMQAADDNAKYNWYSYIGLSGNPDIINDQPMQLVCQEHYDRSLLYQNIAGHLNNILNGIIYYHGAYTRHYLLQLVNDIRWRSKVFNGHFITIVPDSKKQIKQERRSIQNGQGFSNKSEGGFWDKSNKGNI